jgi:hypothetical protein
MPARVPSPDSVVEMYARAVDDAASHLRDLEHTVREDLALAALALGLAIVATRSWPALAMPLFLGGLGVGVLGLRAFVRRWNLLDSLADECDAYLIPQVHRYASREASADRRRLLASQLRVMLDQPRLDRELRSLGMREELEALATRLADDELVLEPRSAVVCKHLLVDAESPLFDPSAHAAELRLRIRDVESGFRSRTLAG